MGALTAARAPRFTTIKSLMLPLAAGLKAYAGARMYADTSAAVIRPGVTGNANLQPIGVSDFTVDNSAGTGTMLCQVTLDKEVTIEWLDNATGSGNVTSSNLFQDVYVQDDHTVTTTNTGGNSSKAGRVWQIDALRGVGVQSYWPY